MTRITKAPEKFFARENKCGTSTDELRQLQIGEMVLCPDTNRGAFHSMAKQIGITIKTKKVSDNEIAIIRII